MGTHVQPAAPRRNLEGRRPASARPDGNLSRVKFATGVWSDYSRRLKNRTPPKRGSRLIGVCPQLFYSLSFRTILRV